MPSTNVLQLEARINEIVAQIIDKRNAEINQSIDNQNSNAAKKNFTPRLQIRIICQLYLYRKVDVILLRVRVSMR